MIGAAVRVRHGGAGWAEDFSDGGHTGGADSAAMRSAKNSRAAPLYVRSCDIVI
eukprot:SAG31_NODE_1293_length_8955_cov_100.938911_8_plen_54_part_00